MATCRFTRLANTFAKRPENVTAALNVHFVRHTFVRVHRTPSEA
jgi:hypothetical protein